MPSDAPDDALMADTVLTEELVRIMAPAMRPTVFRGARNAYEERGLCKRRRETAYMARRAIEAMLQKGYRITHD